jgi:ribosome maturation factor RimP
VVAWRGLRPTLFFGLRKEVAEVGTTDTVRDLVEPVLAGLGYELVDVELSGPTLRIRIDRDGGVDLDAIAQASEAVSATLDRHDPMPGRYTLEVSSPGVERPLRTPDHFRRFVGSTVVVRTHPTDEGDRRVEGVLAAADDEGIVVGDRRIPYDRIERARTTFTWGPSPKPTKKKATTR